MTDLRDLIRPHIKRIGQTEAARRAGLHRPDVCAWLSGKRGLSLRNQIRLGAAVGLDPAGLARALVAATIAETTTDTQRSNPNNG